MNYEVIERKHVINITGDIRNLKGIIKEKLADMIEVKSAEAFKIFHVINAKRTIETHKINNRQINKSLFRVLSIIFSNKNHFQENEKRLLTPQEIQDIYHHLIEQLIEELNKQYTDVTVQEARTGEVLYARYTLQLNEEGKTREVICTLGIKIENREYVELDFL